MKRLFHYVFKSKHSLHSGYTQSSVSTARRISPLLCMQIYKAPGTFEINWKHSHVIEPNPKTSQGDPPSNTLEHPQLFPSAQLQSAGLDLVSAFSTLLKASWGIPQLWSHAGAVWDAGIVHLLGFLPSPTTQEQGSCLQSRGQGNTEKHEQQE